MVMLFIVILILIYVTFRLLVLYNFCDIYLKTDVHNYL